MPIFQMNDCKVHLKEKDISFSEGTIEALNNNTIQKINTRSASGTIVLLFMIFFLFYNTSPPLEYDLVFTYLYSLGAITVAGRIILFCYIKRNTYESPKKIYRLFFSIIAITSIFWGIFVSTTLLAFGFHWESWLALFFLAGLGVGAFAAFCLWRRLSSFCILSFFIPPTVTCLYLGTEVSFIMSIGLTVFCLYLIYQITIWNKDYWHAQINNELLSQHAEELNKARAVSDNANLAKNDFLSAMSHELRTPMNAILGFSQLLTISKRDPLSSQQKISVERILNAGKHLLRLIDDVLDLSKIETGHISLESETFWLREVIDECIELFSDAAEKRNITLISENKATKPIVGDRARFKQVMINLFSNAIKYNKINGTINFGCKDAEDGTVQIFVSDTGIGIPSDALTEIFVPFERLEAVNSDVEGTGIGLSICKKLIELMHGSIYCESDINEGSTFNVTMPAGSINHTLTSLTAEDDKVDESRFSQQTTTEITEKNVTVLYIEDILINTQLMHAIVNKVEGISFLSAETAEEGLIIANREIPNLIITDISLPGMDGYAALKILKATKETSHIPVIGLSADAMVQDIEKANKAGFDLYLTKPMNVIEIIRILRNTIASANSLG